MSKAAYIVKLKGKMEAARVTTIKDKHGNESYCATVYNKLDEVIGMGYGDSPYEACDNVR